MKGNLIAVFLVIFAVASLFNAFGSSDDFFSRDPEATYDKNYQNLDLIIEVPGYKLTPEVMPPITKENSEYAKSMSPEIMEKAKKYVEYRKISHAANYNLYAAKDIGNYVLLYFTEPEVIDGFFELIYSRKLGKIIGSFSGVIAG